MRRTFLALSLALSCAIAGSAQAQSFSTVEERMSAADFRRAGLDKLSPEELAALNAWLQQDAARRGAVAAPSLQQDPRVGFPQGDLFGSSVGPDRITSTIPGDFLGWEGGDDEFTLANGQVWRTIESSSRLRVRLRDPRVAIEKGALGAWYLRVDGYNERVRVRRSK